MKTFKLNSTIYAAIFGLLGGFLGLLAGFTFTPTAFGQSCAAPPAGLVGWWPGDGHALDLWAGHAGTMNNGGDYAPGEVQQGFNFAGNNGYVLVPDAPDLNFGENQDFTAAAWIKPQQLVEGHWNVMAGKADGYAAQNGWYIALDAATHAVTFVCNTNGNSFVLVSTSTPPVGVWTHVAVQRSGSTASIFVNGLLVTNAPAPTDALGNTHPMLIGALYDLRYSPPIQAGEVAKGGVDEMVLFNRALSTNEIASLYAAGMCHPQSVAPPAGLVGWWPGDGHYFDLAGTNIGVPSGGVSFATGLNGQAFHFDGVSSYVSMGNAASLQITGAITVEAWFATTAAVGDYRTLVSKWYSGGISGSYSLVWSAGNLWFGLMHDASSSLWAGSGLALNDGRWHHVAGTWDGTVIRIFVDGVERGANTNAALGAIEVNSLPVMIGADSSLDGGPTSSRFFCGSIDEVAIFNRALSASEIASTYAARSAGMRKPCVAPLSGLVSWWSGDNHALDLVGTNNGTLKGGMGYAAGQAGRAFRFGGTNDYVVIPDSASLQLADAPFAISLWFQTYATTNSQMLLSKGVSDANEEYSINVGEDGSIYWDYGNERDGWCITVPGLVTAGHWHYMVALYDPARSPRGRIFMDGVEKGIANGGGGGHIVSSGSPLYLGTQNAGAPYYARRVSFQGLMDEVAIFNRLLSDEEIALLYAAGGVQCQDFKFLAQPANAVGYVGLPSTLSAVASGPWPVTYQWQRNGVNLSGATNAELVIPNTQFSDAATNYCVVVTAANSLSLTSALATLEVRLCEPPPSGLVGWWTGDGHTFDLAGTNHGVLMNGAGYAGGEAGQGFDLNGTGAYVLIPFSPSLNVTGALTIEMWLKPRQVDGREIASQFDGTANEKKAWDIEVWGGGRLRFGVQGAAGYRYVDTAPGVISTGVLAHVAATFDPATQELKIFVNGAAIPAVLGAGCPLVPVIQSTTTPIRLGTYVDGAGQLGLLYDGLIDEFALYNRALSASEIASICAAGADGKCKALRLFAPPQNAVSYAGVSNAPMSVVASGTGTLTYQWWRDATLLDGQTGATLALPNPTFSDAGNYTVVVSDASGVAITNPVPADLTVKRCEDANQDGLVGRWSGDGHAFDLTTNYNHGSLQGGASYAVGEVGRAFDLDGMSGFVLVPDAPSLHITSTITVEAWIKPLALGVSIVSKYDSSIGQRSWALSLGPDGSLAWFVAATGPGGIERGVDTGAGIVATDVFQHVAATFDPVTQEMAVFVNGVAVPTTLAGYSKPVPAIFESSTPVRIGADVESGGQMYFFNGEIDEVSLYNRVLLPAEIAVIYAAGSDGKCKELKFLAAPPTNAVAYVGISNAPMSVVASGTGTITYQWWRDTTLLAGQTGATLALPNPTFGDAGNYTVVVSDATGVAITNAMPVALTVKRCEEPPAGLVAWWSGDGHTMDLVGTLNGELRGAAGFAPGKAGQGFAFHSPGDYVEIASTNALNLSNGLTLAAWVKPYSLAGTDNIIVSKYDSYGGLRVSWFLLVMSGGNVRFGVAEDGAYDSRYVDTVNAAVPTNAFSYIAATFDIASQELQVYVNGVAVTAVLGAGSTTVSSLYESPVPIRIGSARWGNGSMATTCATVDEVAVFNRALSATEIQALSAAGSDGMCKEITITCPATAVTTNADAGQCYATSVILGVPGTNINVVGVSNDAPAHFPVGQTPVTWTAWNAVGMTVNCVESVTVLDTQPPSITCPTNLVGSTDPGQCSRSNVTFTVTASDNCAVTNVACHPASGSTFVKGVTAVACVATDASGNTNGCSFTVTINDTEAPTITGPSPVTVGPDQGQCFATGVNLGTPFTSDNCGGVSVSNNAPAQFPVGTTFVTWTARDAAGLSVQCQQSVAVTLPRPVVTQSPQNRTNLVGSAVLFNAAADSCAPMTAQWRWNGALLAGATNQSLQITNVQLTNAGTYSVVFANASGAVTSQVATLTVRQAVPVLGWTNPAAITYGTALSGIQLNATSSVPGALIYTPPAGTVLDAATGQVLSVLFTPEDAIRYTNATSTVLINVSPAPLIVTATNASRAFGQANPVLGGTITGLQNGDNITASYACAATPASLPGTYPIVPALVDPSGRRGNYSVTLNDGVLTIAAAAPGVLNEAGMSPLSGKVSLSGLIFSGGTACLSWFEWGSSAAYGSNTAPKNLGAGNVPVPINETLSGLTPNTVVHFRVVCSNSVSASYGADLTAYVTSNSAPVLADIARQSTALNTPLSVALTVSDAETAASNLLVTAWSGNPDLVPQAGLVVSGSGSERSLFLTPVAGQWGRAVIVVIVDDGLTTSSKAFSVDVGLLPGDIDENGIVDLDDYFLLASRWYQRNNSP